MRLLQTPPVARGQEGKNSVLTGAAASTASGSVEYPAEEEITVLTIFEPVAYRFEPPASLPLALHVGNEEKQSTLGDVSKRGVNQKGSQPKGSPSLT